MKYRVAILGASGFTGAELYRLISANENFEVKVLTADSNAGELVSSLYPHLNTREDLRFKRFDEVQAELDTCEVVFCGLPHGEAMKVLPGLKNRLVIDLGGDFRLTSASEYEKWYGRAHLAPSELGKWQYGLTELFRENIKKATRIANPGCFATASILALAPIVKSGMAEGVATIDAYTGTSGGGRAAQSHLQYSMIHEDVRAYKVGSHQHTPEIELALQQFSGRKTVVSFTPHLVPMVRGIHVTASITARSGLSAAEVTAAFEEFYRPEPYVQVVSKPPGTKEVRGSNGVRICPVLDSRAGRIIVLAVIDNLVKGASGQALQNALCALGINESAGVPKMGVYP